MSFALRSIAVAALLFAAGCHGYITVDGYQAAYVDVPAGYERAPRYMHGNANVYEVDGHYYRQYNNRWVMYHERPHDLRRDEQRHER